MEKKILILDDDADIAAMMTFMMKRHGFNTLSSPTGNVLDDLHQIQPDLILMDNRLGDGFGKDFCKQLKLNPATAHYKVVLVSAADSLAEMAAESLADAYVAKPFDLYELLAVVTRLTAS